MPSSLEKIDHVPIQSIQIETTSRCTLDCITCLKSVYKKSWQEREMGAPLFSRILAQVRHEKPAVHLQGWGEPLGQDDFLSFVRQVKKADMSASFTTNGTVMTENLAESLMATGFDGITFSMAGACSLTQDKLRGVGTFERLCKAITTFASVRARYHGSGTRIAVSYLLTPQSVKELPKAVSWCRRVGVDTFATVNLSQVSSRVQQNLAFIPSKKESNQYRFLRIRTNMSALFARMELKMRPFYPRLLPVCNKDPLNNLFISATGDVSPCVFLAPPVKNGIVWRWEGLAVWQKNFVMGNVNNLPLKEIWTSKKAEMFREKFKKRKAYYDERLARVSFSMSGSVELETAIGEIKKYFSSHPPPEQCLACAQLYGY